MPVVIPDGVKIEMVKDILKVSGPKGSLEQSVQPVITVNIGEAEVVFARPDDKPENRALHGLTRALLNNMVIGVTQGYEKILEIHGVGYRAKMEGKTLSLQLGHS